jgi:hypothetical protein
MAKHFATKQKRIIANYLDETIAADNRRVAQITGLDLSAIDYKT